MNFFRNAAGILVTSTVTIPIALLTSILLARFMSVEDRGLYAIAVTFASVTVVLTQFGWGSASIYRLRRIGSPPEQVATIGLLATLIISVVVVLAGAALEPFFSRRFFDGAPPVLLFLALAMVPFQLLAVLVNAIARGLNLFRYQNAYNLAMEVTALGAIAYALVLLDGDVITALRAFLATQAVLALGLAVVILRRTGLSLLFSVPEVLEGARFGLKSYAQMLAGQLHERIDLFMLAWLLEDPGQVAIYAIAAGFVQRLKLVPDAVGGASYPQIAGMGGREAADFACAVSRQAVIWVLVMGAAMAIVAPFLIPLLYGAPYAESVAPFAVLLPAVGFFTIYRVLSRFFTATNRHQANIYTQAASTVVNVALNLWLIPRLGIMGAAVASLVSYTLEAVLITSVFARLTGRGVGDLIVFRRDDLEPYRRRLGSITRRFRRAD